MAEDQMTIDEAAGAVMEMDGYIQAFNKLKDVVMMAKQAAKEQAVIDGLIQERSTELARVTKETAEAKEALVALRADVKAGQDEKAAILGDLKALRNELTTLKSAKQHLDAEIVSRKRFISDDLEKQLAAKNQELSRAEQAVNDRKDTIAQLDMKIAEFRRMVPAGGDD